MTHEHVNTQDTLVREHLSTQGTLTREHVFGMQSTHFRRLTSQTASAFVGILLCHPSLIEGDVEKLEHLLHDIDTLSCIVDTISLSENSREVAVHNAGYVANKLNKKNGKML